MSLAVFIAVLGAAALHAVWNGLVKGNDDKHLAMAAVVLGHVPIALVLIPFVPFPASPSWPYAVTAVLLHVGYQFFLLQAYRFGDFTQVYPIARGSAPLIVAAISLLFLGVALNQGEITGIVIIAAGVMSLGLAGIRQTTGHGAVLALVTGCFIAAYTLVDGAGARSAGSPLGYYAWVALGNAALSAVLIHLTMPRLLRQVFTRGRRIFLIGGNVSFLAYALVTWSFTQAPIALVSALRETSILFALLIGRFILGEQVNKTRTLAALLVLIGAVLLRLSHD